jgi:predicted dehydrogenase
VESIVNDTPHIATGEEGLLVMEILDAIYKSAEEGEPVQIL